MSTAAPTRPAAARDARPRPSPPPAWLDEPGLTVTLAEVRRSLAFAAGLAEAEASPMRRKETMMLSFAIPPAGDRPAGATISPCGLYRYDLRRAWGRPGLKVVNFVMLNPSTADAEADDPTIRRCLGYAKAWGFGGLTVTNLYAFRATEPDALWEAEDPVGPLNDEFIRRWASTADRVVMAWGNHGTRGGRGAAVMKLLKGVDARASYLKITGNGQPGHPLYLPGDLVPIPMEAAVVGDPDPMRRNS